MKLTTTAFADMGAIPGEFAFCVVDPQSHVRLSDNRNPDFAWQDLPQGTRSLALVCHDPDAPLPDGSFPRGHHQADARKVAGGIQEADRRA